MEYNIDRSSSVSMFKKERKLDDGKMVWDSVVKLRKKNPTECSKYPKKHLGIRNHWIKDFSNLLSDKASSYVLETMSAERTNRQEEIAQTLLNRFNNFLEQDATMKEPQTLTHKAMVMMADRLSLWLDKNVKVSKNATLKIRQFEEEEKKRKLMEEIARLEQERRDREEERKRKMAEEAAKKLEEPKSATEIMNPPPDAEPEPSPPKEEEPDKQPDTEDGKSPEKDDKPPKPDDGPPDDQPPPDQQPPPPPQTEPNVEPKPEEPTEDQRAGGAAQGNEEEPKANESSVNKEDKTDEQPAEEQLVQASSEIFVEPDLPPDSPMRSVLDIGEDVQVVDSGYAAPDVTDTPSDALDVSPSAIPTSGSEFSVGFMNVEPSKDSATLVQEILGASVDEKDTVDEEEIDINLIGKSMNEKTDKVLHELAEIIATTREEHSPLQEAIKDIMEKELEDRLGDKDVETINEVAGKVGTWMDKMVERAAEEYGDRRSPSRGRSLSPMSISQPKRGPPVSQGPEVGAYGPTGAYPPTGAYIPPMPYPPQFPQAYPPTAVAPIPKPTAAPPEGLAESSFETVSSRAPAPVSQKPKGPIFELRKIDTKNIFNVAGVTHTKAKRKIREARGLASSSRRVSQESLDIEEWAEWAGLVSDVGRNWAKWIEEVAQVVERPTKNNDKSLIACDAKEWKNISKELQREGDIWMKKVTKKRNKHARDPSPEAKPLSV